MLPSAALTVASESHHARPGMPSTPGIGWLLTQAGETVVQIAPAWGPHLANCFPRLLCRACLLTSTVHKLRSKARYLDELEDSAGWNPGRAGLAAWRPGVTDSRVACACAFTLRCALGQRDHLPGQDAHAVPSLLLHAAQHTKSCDAADAAVGPIPHLPIPTIHPCTNIPPSPSAKALTSITTTTTTLQAWWRRMRRSCWAGSTRWTAP